MEVIGLKKQEKMGFEETELRLGLPGNGGSAAATEGEGGGEAARKRGFSETENNDTVDLMLNLSSSKEADHSSDKPSQKTILPADPAKPPAKYVFIILLSLLHMYITGGREERESPLLYIFLVALIFPVLEISVIHIIVTYS